MRRGDGGSSSYAVGRKKKSRRPCLRVLLVGPKSSFICNEKLHVTDCLRGPSSAIGPRCVSVCRTISLERNYLPPNDYLRLQD